MNKVFSLLILILISACTKPTIEIDNAYVPVRTENQKMYAAYLTIKNNSDTPLELIGIKSESFKSVMLHQSSLENGMAKMRHLEKLIINNAESVKLEPNGKHIMLMGAKENLWEKESFILTLEFSNGTNIQQTIPLKKLTKK